METIKADVSQVGVSKTPNPGIYPAIITGVEVRDITYGKGERAKIIEPIFIIPEEAKKAFNPKAQTDEDGFVIYKKKDNGKPDIKKPLPETDADGNVKEVSGENIIGYTMYSKGIFVALVPRKEPEKEWKQYINFLKICGIELSDEQIKAGEIPIPSKNEPALLGCPMTIFVNQDTWEQTKLDKVTGEKETVVRKRMQAFDYYPWGNKEKLSPEELSALVEKHTESNNSGGNVDMNNAMAANELDNESPF